MEGGGEGYGLECKVAFVWLVSPSGFLHSLVFAIIVTSWRSKSIFLHFHSDKPLHYLWVNASCHPEYGEIFGISSENLPVLLFAKPKQRLFKTLHDDLTKEHVSEIVSEIFLGREDLSPFSRFNDMISVDCTKTETPEVKSKDEETNEAGKTKEKK